MDYTTRLTSFCSWKVPRRFDVRKMAEAGFTYASNSAFPDQVYCSFCNVFLSRWKKSVGNPLYIHQKFSPDCPFLSFISDPRVQYSLSKGKEEKHVFNTYKRIHMAENTPEEFLELVTILGEPSPATDFTCKVCMEENCTILFLPCRHLCSCKKCVKALTKCPICRCEPFIWTEVFV
jgi:hypothetical protein